VPRKRPLTPGGGARPEERGAPRARAGAKRTARRAKADAPAAPLPNATLDPHERDHLLAAEHAEPHRVLGAHPASRDGIGGVVVRAYHPDAVAAEIVLDEPIDGASGDDDPPRRDDDSARALGSTPTRVPLEPLGPGGLFAAFLPHAHLPISYRHAFTFAGGERWERDDPYRFLPTVGELDLHLFAEGTHRRLWEMLGARARRIDGVDGVAFAVWAPNARRVSVVGEFCRWDGRALPMRTLGASGVWELFVPGLAVGALYKYEILTRSGTVRLKTDPVAFAMEHPPSTASRVAASSHAWDDGAWMAARPRRDVAREPVAIYEAHLGSWARVAGDGNRPMSYREIARPLVDHVKHLGFTHIELLPVAEHPFGGSWGYQVSGYFAPTARYGTPDDFRAFVDHCHQEGVGVILDWVPAHFPKDDFSLRQFDGTALYEHDDPRRAEHPDWGTLIFNYGRHEVRGFLISNALYWLNEFHVDGLRVDAVASMLYLDYSRKEGQWAPNRFGGRENLEAVDFIRALNETVRIEAPGCFTVAEESTAWPGVTRPASDGGLGFAFKWNMGWMHDTLEYFKRDPLYRTYHHDELTFAMLYEQSERFVMPLSHDEVVHGKGSLLNKMPGDAWQKFANLRVLYSYLFTRPGKKLLFMGSELAPWSEWNHEVSLDWSLAGEPIRAGLARLVAALGRLYRETPCLWRGDPDPWSFSWIDCGDRQNSVLTYVRREREETAAGEHVIVVLNLTPQPRDTYRIGAPAAGRYVERLCTDDPRFGGSGFGSHGAIDTEPHPYHGQPQSMTLRIPPLAALVLVPAR
jgi:1,4-alpha-glucan branching enzyme